MRLGVPYPRRSQYAPFFFLYYKYFLIIVQVCYERERGFQLWVMLPCRDTLDRFSKSTAYVIEAVA